MKTIGAAVWIGAAVLSGIIGMGSRAHATVTQPNGLVVPIHVNNGETQVDDLLKVREPKLNFTADASNIPETFSPLCSFTAELILKQTGSRLAIGWYNVIPGATVAPTNAEIYQIIGPQVFPGDPGAKITGQSIKDDPNYKGGLIGFALKGDTNFQTKYSEKKWNAVCTGCANPGPWVHSITYVSRELPNAFYLGFEDGNGTATAFNNDGDYNDYFFLFTGLTCNGGGKPCDVPGEKGVCSAGVTKCDPKAANGVVCSKVINPDPSERCDGLDNNCDGQIDENAPCPQGLICDRGHCVTQCSGEFGCAAGNTCVDGHCIDMQCTGVTCNGATICKKGVCVSPCTDIVCPGTQVCRVGRCVDACEGVTCPSGQICSNGACITGCDCYPCGDPALGCSKQSNICVENACVNLTCGAGDVCKGGTCVATCASAKCPSDQRCEGGKCVDLPVTDPNNPGTNPDDNGQGGGSLATGCDCRISPDSSRPSTLALFAALGVFGALLHRRRRSSRGL